MRMKSTYKSFPKITLIIAMSLLPTFVFASQSNTASLTDIKEALSELILMSQTHTSRLTAMESNTNQISLIKDHEESLQAQLQAINTRLQVLENRITPMTTFQNSHQLKNANQVIMDFINSNNK